ncbi:MAG TPA: epoxide hydrolase [Anaerolineales bacterium]|nr:epoxide hydrolase [Anaerolineales bacterium]
MNIRPYEIAIPQKELKDLQKRIENTRWPSQGAGEGWTRGMPLEYTKKLAEYWATKFDWREQEAKLNKYPQFVTEIDGQTIHFLHVRSSEPNAIPLLLFHGYPSSFVEFLHVLDPLTNPSGSGNATEQAFHVVVPSLPGFGFSTPVISPGWEISQMAKAFNQLMGDLGYDRYAIHGGDVGAGLCAQLCIQAGERIIGSLIPTDPGAIATEYTPPTPHLNDDERQRHEQLKAARREDFGYIQIQSTRPQTIAYSLTDSPVGQMAWIVEKFKEWTDPSRELPEQAVDLDQLLTTVSVYWFGRGGASAAHFLYEAAHAAPSWGETHNRPQGFVVFGHEPLVRRILDPEHKLAYWNEHDCGGHFPAMEAPELLVGDIRAFFQKLR